MELKAKLDITPDAVIGRIAATLIIGKSKGKVFTATFRKRDGTLRVMNCRVGVTKGVTGKGMAYDPNLNGMIPVFDMQANDWRMLNLSTTIRLKINKVLYAVIG
jgi:hypothetical protein